MTEKRKYKILANQVVEIVERKQVAYGDSFGKCGEVLKILYPNGVDVEHYTDMLCIVRILDKIFRIATDNDSLGESPYMDIIGYGLLGASIKKELD